MLKKYFIALLLCIPFCLMGWNALGGQPITVVYNRGVAPIKFTTDTGEPSGMLNEYWQQLGRKANLTFKFVEVDSFDASLEMVKNGTADLHAGLFYTDARHEFLDYSLPVLDLNYYLYTSPDLPPFNSLAQTRGLLLGVVQGGYTENYIKKTVPGSQLLIFDDFASLFKAVLDGELKAFVASDIHLNYYLAARGLENPFNRSDNSLYEQTYYGAVAKGNSPLLEKLIAGQQLLSEEDNKSLKDHWLTAKVEDALRSKIKTLTPQEIAWIKAHPKIILGSDYLWPPFDFSDQHGNHSGVSADYIKLIEQRTGLKIEIRSGIWDEILAQAKKGELDGLACAVKTEDRTTYLDFSKPYLAIPTVIIVKNDNLTISDLSDLYGKTVSINNGSYLHDWMAKRYPQIKLHLSTSNQASIEAVSYSEVDAYIGNLAVANYIIRERLMTNLKVVKRLTGMMTETAVAIDKRQPLLLGIIQKALDSITDQERQAILDKWYMATTEVKVDLTLWEKEWLREHPVIQVAGASNWAPLSYRNRVGESAGIVTEYLELLAAKSGLQFQTVLADNWDEVLTLAQKRHVDLVNAIPIEEKRTAIVDFSDSYLQVEAVLVTRDDINFIDGLKRLEGRRVGTIRGFTIDTHLAKDYPSLTLQRYVSAAAGLQGLSRSEIDVFVIDIPTFDYYSKELSLANLKISGLTPYTFNIAFGVTKDHPELLSILNKSLALITQQEKNRIYNNWVTLEKPLIDYSLIWKTALAAAVFLLALFYWNRRLAHEVFLRKQAETVARQASRAKSDFLANMSHEIRTPMNSVLGFAELLDHMISDPEQKSYLKSIRTGGRALLEIINDILDLSKIEAGKMEIRPEAFSLEDLFSEMDDFFKARMAQKNLQFSAQLAEEFPPYVKMDSARLRQVLINLIGNALKFTECGTIRLDCHAVQIDEEAQQVAFTLTVADTGIGIPPEQQQGIFNKFEQQEGQDNTRYGGTGLGLSICRSFTQLMGGTISVASVPGKGTQFDVVFSNVPIVQENIVQETFESVRVSQFRPTNVLVADDVKDNRRLVIGHFKGSAVHFHEAENGKVALELLAQIPIDMVLMDLRMPVLNGYETITAIRQDDTLKHIPVVAFTASVMGEDMEKVKQYGFDGYLRKPVSRQELLRVAAAFLPLADPQPEPLTGELEPVDLSLPQLTEFLAIVDAELLPRWQAVKDRGDFDLVSQFAVSLLEQAAAYSIAPIVAFGERLQEYVTSFDIIEVDGMMKQFPALVSAMKQQLSHAGGDNDAQV